MNYDYLDKIRALISLNTRRRTSNILEGSFRSVYRGRSLEFDDLKEYVPGDDVHDIDWKSSSRTGKTLIRRYMAERRHNVLFIPDSGKGMLGHMPSGEVKWETALMAAGIIAYLMDGQGADFAFLYGGARGMEFSGFKAGHTHLENQLHRYRDVMLAYRGGVPGTVGASETARTGKQGTAGEEDRRAYTDLGRVLDRAAEIDLRKKIIVILTDRAGLGCMDEFRLRKLTVNNDLLVMCMDDVMLTGSFEKQAKETGRGRVLRMPESGSVPGTAGAGRNREPGKEPGSGISGRANQWLAALKAFKRRLSASQTFDLDADRYEDEFVLAGKDLQKAERQERERILEEARRRLRRNRGTLTVLERESEALTKILELFDRYGHASYG